MNKKHVKIVPNDELQNQLSHLVGNRKVLYIICELNHMDELKIKGQMADAAKKRSKPLYCPTTDTTYTSIKQASIELILDPSAISRCLSGKQKSTNGYTFNEVKQR